MKNESESGGWGGGQRWWSRWRSGLLDLLYPSVCFSCGIGLKGGRSLCGDCAGRIRRLREPFCLRCGEEFEGLVEGGEVCVNCRGQDWDFDFARPAASCGGLVREMLHAFKYGRRVDLGLELAEVAAGVVGEDGRVAAAVGAGWPLVPVPLHGARERWRYFNQAEELARWLSPKWGLPVWRILERVRATGSQAKRGRGERLRSLAGAFRLREDRLGALGGWKGGVVLVDDVLTTGATADACARVLRAGGCQNVVVVTVMRG